MKKIILLLVLLSANVFTQIAPEWEVNYPLSSNNSIISILNDPNGNMYVLSRSSVDTNNNSGYFVLLAKTNLSGTLLWKRIYSRPGLDSGDFPISMVFDNQYNIYVLDASHGYISGIDLGVVKYNQNGNFLWNYFYTSSGGVDSYDSPAAICSDIQGNCYLTGFSSNFYVDSIITIKLNSSGIFQWKQTYLTTSTRLSNGMCLIADNASNIYVGGMVNDSASGFMNAVILKYNSSGILQWNKKYSGPQSMSDCFVDLKFDNSGNLLATGSSDGGYYLDSASVLLQKYDPNGNLLWSQTYHTINPGGEVGIKLLVDNSNNIFIMGRTDFYESQNASSSFILKYNSSGSLLWSNRHGDYYQYPVFVNNISFDLNENILVTGYEKRFNRTNLLLLKYNKSNGNKEWSYLFNKTGSSTDRSMSAGYFSNNLFIAGTTNSDFLLMKMQPTNSYTYTFRRDNLNKSILDSQYTYDTVMLNADQLPPNAYIRSINVTIDTLLHGAMGDIEITLRNGAIEDTLFYRRGGPFDNMIGTNLNDTSLLNICGNGLPPFTGYFAPCRTLSKHLFMPGSGPWILKIYDRKAPDTGTLKSWSLILTYETLIGINPISTEVPKNFSLMQNFPNPFNPVTKIKFNIPKAGNTKISIFDVTGKEIKTLVDEFLVQGIYEIDFDGTQYSSGVYFYRFESGDFTETKKMVLIK